MRFWKECLLPGRDWQHCINGMPLPLNNKQNQVPSPDVTVVPINLSEQKCVVIASDGLWDVMSPNEVVSFIWDYEHDTPCHQESKDVVRALINESYVYYVSHAMITHLFISTRLFRTCQ